MSDKPILFSGPMVRALLAGTKTQTRRALNPQPYSPASVVSYDRSSGSWMSCEPSPVTGGTRQMDPWRPLRIKVGDRLYVREAWRCNGWATDVATVMYRASEGDGYTAMTEQYPVVGKKPMRVTGTWRPGIHMPRWASRLTLTVSDVRVERLQDISEGDAWAEGCKKGDPDDVGNFFPAEEPDPSGIGFRGWDNARDWYADLWDEINGNGAWDANPSVAAYTFTVEHGNIDSVMA